LKAKRMQTRYVRPASGRTDKLFRAASFSAVLVGRNDLAAVAASEPARRGQYECHDTRVRDRATTAGQPRPSNTTLTESGMPDYLADFDARQRHSQRGCVF
jgi:hypothetical protein